MTFDLLTGAQDAAIALLRAHLPDDQKAMARTSLKENTAPPWHLIGDIDTEDQSQGADQFEIVTLDVQTVYRGGDRRELLALMHQVRLATDRKSIEINGASYRFSWLGAVGSAAASDGVTYAGVTSLKIFAEPA